MSAAIIERAVAYYRVSTDHQAREGFSLEGQRAAVHRYVSEEGLELIAEYSEAESGYRPSKITLEKRPGLQGALRDCRRHKARLVIAALDRLARNVVFIASLIETRVPFVALDIPNATPFMIHIYAAVAEEESRRRGHIIRVSQAIAKSRGKRWDQRCRQMERDAKARAEALRPIIDEIRATGLWRVYHITKELNRRNVPHFRGTRWYPTLVQAIVDHLGYYEKAAKPWYEIHHDVAVERAEALRPIVAALRADGRRTDRDLADGLNLRGFKTPMGLQWTRRGVFDLRKRYFRAPPPCEPDRWNVGACDDL